MKAIIYYSYSGHTKRIGNMIKDRLNCDIIELEKVEPYTNNYDELVEEAKNMAGTITEIKEVDITKYDEIILGMPVWWYTYPPVITTFIRKYDLSNKKIIPFVTNAGWIGHTINDLQKEGLNVSNSINIKFNGDNLENITEVNKWIETL